MTNISATDFGKTGKVTNNKNGESLTGKLDSNGATVWGTFWFLPTGSNESILLYEDEWRWKRDPDPLPEAVGSVVQLEAAGLDRVYMRVPRGWVGQDGDLLPTERIKESAATLKTSILFDAGEENDNG